MPEPPTQIHEGESHRAVQSCGQENEPHDHDKVRGAAGEEESVRGPDRDGPPQQQADPGQKPRAAMTATAPPTMTVRPSPARAPAVVRATAAAVATSALTPTP